MKSVKDKRAIKITHKTGAAYRDVYTTLLNNNNEYNNNYRLKYHNSYGKKL